MKLLSKKLACVVVLLYVPCSPFGVLMISHWKISNSIICQTLKVWIALQHTFLLCNLPLCEPAFLTATLDSSLFQALLVDFFLCHLWRQEKNIIIKLSFLLLTFALVKSLFQAWFSRLLKLLQLVVHILPCFVGRWWVFAFFRLLCFGLGCCFGLGSCFCFPFSFFGRCRAYRLCLHTPSALFRPRFLPWRSTWPLFGGHSVAKCWQCVCCFVLCIFVW